MKPPTKSKYIAVRFAYHHAAGMKGNFGRRPYWQDYTLSVSLLRH